MTTLSENPNGEKSASPPNSFPQYAPPANPQGIPIQPDAKFHKPLFSLAKKMMKKSGRTKKTSQDVHIGRKKKHRWY